MKKNSKCAGSPDIDLLDRIMSIDLSIVSSRLSDSPKGRFWNRVSTEHVELLYRKFLFLSLTAQDFKAVPTTTIDAFWHEHILMTQKYFLDCNFICGSYIHHDPQFGTRSAEERAYYLNCRRRTIMEFDRIFGVSREELGLS